MSPVIPKRSTGIALMLAAGLCWSLGGIIVRKLTLTDTWEIVFWRALFMSAFLGVLLLALRGRGAVASVRSIGLAGAISSVCLAAQIYFFILALSHTTAANTFVLMSISPLLAALVGLLVPARERWHGTPGSPSRLRSAASSSCSAKASAPVAGSATPLRCACRSAMRARFCLCARCRARRARRPDLMPTVFVGALFAMTPALFLGWPFDATGHDVLLLAVMGCVQLGMGCWLMTLAVPHLRAAEMGLLALTETILAPVWVWLGTGEAPTGAALAGGVIIVGALAANGWVTLRSEHPA